MTLSSWYAVATVSLFISGCSPYVFDKEISKFADASKTVSDAVTASAAITRQEAADRQRYELMPGRHALRSADCDPPSEAVSQRPRCRLVKAATVSEAEQKLDAQREEELAALSRLEQQSASKLQAITDYTEALRAVSNAADRAAYDAAASRLGGSIKGLVDVGNVATPGIGLGISAITRAGLWLVGAALDAERRATLTSAVHAADPNLKVLAGALQDDLGAINRIRVSIVAGAVSQMADSLTPLLTKEEYAVRLLEAQQLAARQDALLRSRPAETVDKLVKAHRALSSALDDPEKQFADLVQAVGDFATEAKALRDALTAKPTS